MLTLKPAPMCAPPGPPTPPPVAVVLARCSMQPHHMSAGTSRQAWLSTDSCESAQQQ